MDVIKTLDLIHKWIRLYGEWEDHYEYGKGDEPERAEFFVATKDLALICDQERIEGAQLLFETAQQIGQPNGTLDFDRTIAVINRLANLAEREGMTGGILDPITAGCMSIDGAVLLHGARMPTESERRRAAAKNSGGSSASAAEDDARAAVTGAPDPDSGCNQVLREGSTWRITYQGKTSGFPALIGFEILARLLSRPDQDISCLELARRLPWGATEEPVMDDRYLTDVNRSIARAEQRGDMAEAADLRETLRKACNRVGRQREPEIDTESARKAVGKAIKTALDHMKGVDDGLRRHLKRSLHKASGRYPSYRPPDGTPRWLVRWK